jgi:antirestriction protein
VADFEDRYIGQYRSRVDFAEDWLEQTGGLDGIPVHLARYIDFDAFGRDAVLGGDVVAQDGYWLWNR